MDTTKSKKSVIFLSIIGIAILILGILYAIFHKDIKEFGDGLERIGDRKQDYKRDDPNATKSEMDKAFSDGISNLEKWTQNYKKDHPNATDSDVEKAWNDAWGK